MKDFKKSFGAKKPFRTRESYAAARGPRMFGARSDAPTEMHQATCNECHKKCEVPFRPNGKKPIYCRDCFKGKEEAPAFSRAPRSEAPDTNDLKRELATLNTKIDRLIDAIESQTRILSKSK